VGVYVAAPGGGEEEVVQQVATATPDAGTSAVVVRSAATPTPPSGLPPAAEGYTWYVTPQNYLNEHGQPLYAFQHPAGWQTSCCPLHAISPSAGYAGPRLVVSVVDASFLAKSGMTHPFYWDLPRDCQDISATGTKTAGAYTWDVISFTCTTRDKQDPSTVITVTGRAAEARLLDKVVTVLAFEPEEAVGGALETALETLVLQ
jgi:hypothetical protein